MYRDNWKTTGLEKQSQIEVYVRGKQKEIGWVTLPMEKEDMKALILEASGVEGGKDYDIAAYTCAYFDISPYDELEILNRVADMIERLNLEEKLQLKGWCRTHENGMEDLVEIGNVAFQIKEGKIDYLHNIRTEEELGEHLLQESGIGQELWEKMKNVLDLDGDYIDSESVGRDFDINNQYGYFITDLENDKKIVGYIRNDREIDEFEYNREELLEMDLDQEMGRRVLPDKDKIVDDEKKAMKTCMKRAAEKAPQQMMEFQQER